MERVMEDDENNSFKIPHLKQVTARRAQRRITTVHCSPVVLKQAEEFIAWQATPAEHANPYPLAAPPSTPSHGIFSNKLLVTDKTVFSLEEVRGWMKNTSDIVRKKKRKMRAARHTLTVASPLAHFFALMNLD